MGKVITSTFVPKGLSAAALGIYTCIKALKYSAGEEKSPYFLFHGETALRKILKFQGETANFSEKFQGEIAQFLRENMEL